MSWGHRQGTSGKRSGMGGIVNSASAPPLRPADEVAETDEVAEQAAGIETALTRMTRWAQQKARAKMASTVKDIAWMLQL